MAQLARNALPIPPVNPVNQPARHSPYEPTSHAYVPTLSVQMAEWSSCILLTLQGELELETIPICRHYLSLALEASNASPTKEPKAIIVDLSECCFVDSQGIQLFINTERAARERDHAVIFACPPARLLYVLQRTRLVKFLNIAETKEAAIAMIASGRN